MGHATKNSKIGLFAILLFFTLICGIGYYSSTRADSVIKSKEKEDFDKPAYLEDFPMCVSSEMCENKRCNNVVITFGNKTDAVISAVQYLITYKNVYGEVISKERLIFDSKIQQRDYKTYEFNVAKKIKFIEIRVYSVYYYNNCKKEWGTRKINTTEIINNLPINTACQI